MNVKKLPYCTAPLCSRINLTPNRHFFKFPKEYDRWLRWVYACERLDLVDKGPDYAYRNCRLCNLHFEEKWYKVNKVRAYLHPDAIPTIFFRPSFMEPNVMITENELEDAVVQKTEGNVMTVENKKEDAVVQKTEGNVMTIENKKEDTVEQKIDGNTCTKETTQMQDKSNAGIRKLTLSIAVIKVQTVKPNTSIQKPVNGKKPVPDSVKIQRLLLKNQKLRAQKKSLRETIRRLRLKNKKNNLTVEKTTNATNKKSAIPAKTF